MQPAALAACSQYAEERRNAGTGVQVSRAPVSAPAPQPISAPPHGGGTLLSAEVCLSMTGGASSRCRLVSGSLTVGSVPVLLGADGTILNASVGAGGTGLLDATVIGGNGLAVDVDVLGHDLADVGVGLGGSGGGIGVDVGLGGQEVAGVEVGGSGGLIDVDLGGLGGALGGLLN